MGNEMTKIIPGLYVGNIRDSEDEKQVNENNITHVLSIYQNAKPAVKFVNRLQYKCIDAEDNPSQDLSSWFQECTDFIHQSRLSGGAVLVHCLAGVSRSVTITCAYLMTVTSLGWPEVLDAVRSARPHASPNFGFQQQLMRYHKGKLKEERERISRVFPSSTLKLQDEENSQALLATTTQTKRLTTTWKRDTTTESTQGKEESGASL